MSLQSCVFCIRVCHADSNKKKQNETTPATTQESQNSNFRFARQWNISTHICRVVKQLTKPEGAQLLKSLLNFFWIQQFGNIAEAVWKMRHLHIVVTELVHHAGEKGKHWLMLFWKCFEIILLYYIFFHMEINKKEYTWTRTAKADTGGNYFVIESCISVPHHCSSVLKNGTGWSGYVGVLSIF